MENIRRYLETRLAHNKMSPEQVRLTENRIMTFGLGPENFDESEGYSGYSFDEQREAPDIQTALASLSDVDLKALRGELFEYETYLSSQAGKLAAFEGKKPILERDGVGHFGLKERVTFLIKSISEESHRRKLGFLKTVGLLPKALNREDEIRREVQGLRNSKEMEDKSSRLFGDQYLEDSLEAMGEPPEIPEEKLRKVRENLLKSLDEVQEDDDKK